jgi:hypothetical protein
MQAADGEGFIGLQVMPIFAVDEYSGTYPVLPAEILHNLHKTERTAEGGYNRIAGRFEEGFFKTTEKGLEAPVDRRFAAAYKNKLDMEMAMALILFRDVLRAQEYAIKSKLFNTSNFSATNAATAWSTSASADPQYDVDLGKESLRSNGIVADTLILNYAAYMDVRQTDAVQDVVYQLFPDAAKSGKITLEHLKAYFDVDKLLVPGLKNTGSLYNTSKSGQDASLSDIWGSQYCMLCKTANPGDDISTPCVGRTFLWNEGFNDEEMIVEQYYEDKVRADILRVRYDAQHAFLASYDEDESVKSAISKNAGYLLDHTASS